jgi:hypothetical protein
LSDQNSADASGGRSPWARRLLIAVVVVFVGVIVYRLVSVRRGGHRHQPPQSVGVAAVTIGEMPEAIRSLGTVTAIATVTVVPQLSGFLTEVGFTEGQDVAKGDSCDSLGRGEVRRGWEPGEATEPTLAPTPIPIPAFPLRGGRGGGPMPRCRRRP